MTDQDTVSLYYQDTGDTNPDVTPLLLLPGGGVTIELNWAAALPTLSAGRRVVAVEMQGHGRTPDLQRPLTFGNSAEDVVALLDRLGLEQVDVLGFSNGGNVAMRLAMENPDRVRRQIVASAFYQREGMIDGFWDGMDSAQIDTMPELYLQADRELNPDPAHQRRLFELDTTQMRSFVDWTDDDLRRITAATLFVVGDQDAVRVEHVTRMATLVPGARLLVLPASHGDYLGERLAAGEDLTTMNHTLPWLLHFLDTDTTGRADVDTGQGDAGGRQ